MKPSLILFALLGIFLFSYPAYACTCGNSEPPVEFNEARAIFIGKMLEGTEEIKVADELKKSYVIEAGKVRFAIEEIFKGPVAKELTVEIASHAGTNCGPYGLKRGERYLVYAYANGDNWNELYTGVCTRTSLVSSDYIKEDLAFLRHLPPVGSGGNIEGSIWTDHRSEGKSPFANLIVHITGPDRKVRSIRTNSNGEFRLSKVKPGKYQLDPQLPASYALDLRFVIDRLPTEIEVEDRGTAVASLKVVITSLVSGRLVDTDGHGVNTAMFKFLRTTSPDNDYAAAYGHSTGENGDFTFEDVPPGEFVMLIEMEHHNIKKNRNYYYPGTFDRHRATPFKVRLGDTQSGFLFTLPDEFKVRSIDGQVVWPTGKPAANVEVGLWCARGTGTTGLAVEFSTIRTKTDDQGRFHLEGFANEVYKLMAQGEFDDNGTVESKDLHSVPRDIELTNNLTDLKLVLSESGARFPCDNP